MRTTISSKEGWTKTGKGEYTHATGVQVRRTDFAWEVCGIGKDRPRYSTLWAAMYAAAQTPATLGCALAGR